MINLKSEDLNTLSKILKKASIDFYIYGPRAKGSNSEFSDIDICYKEPLAKELKWQPIEELENSDLPFKVDLVDYNKCSEEFQNLIKADLRLL